MLISARKKLIRQEFKEIRHNLDPDYIVSSLPKVIENSINFLEKLKYLSVIGAYWPLDNELDLVPLLHHLISKNITCALPVLAEDTNLTFKIWTQNTKLSTDNCYHIPEPIDTDSIIPNIIIVPLVTCDIKGNRIGYGKGYYDKYLAKQRKTNQLSHVIGLCYEKQISRSTLPHEEHDQQLDVIITEKRVYTV